MSFAVHGLAVSQGIAIGHAHLVSHALLEVAHFTIAPRHVESEVTRLHSAVAAVKAELTGLKNATLTGAAPSEVDAFVGLHLMFLEDPMLVEAAEQLIRTRRANAEWALVQQMEQLVDQFEAIEDPYLRERKADVVQIVERVVKVLLGHPGHLPPKRKDGLGTIIVAHDLSPTDTIGFKDHAVAGFITDVGGPTGHTAIVARSMSIPAVVALRHIRHVIKDDEMLIVDGTRGVVIVDPDERVLEEYRLRKAELELERSKLKRLKSMRPATLDGEEVQLLANIELPPDAVQAKGVEADGIGLFRTEFLFMSRDTWPDEDEQFEAYRTVVKTMAGRPVTVRTLDVGADKELEGATQREDNPALGLRAIRYCLAEPKMYLTQLRALLRASHYGKLKILIPMLASSTEIDQTLVLLEKAKAQLRERKIKFDEHVPVGGMIEVPAAALCLGAFTKRLQFLSIGTNDLIQYTLAIDRGNEAVAHLYNPLHPAVLRLIHQTIQAGAKAGIPVSVCGEMAGDPDCARLLIGMGLRHFSMHPAQILEVKQEILRADSLDLTAKVQRLLKLEEPDKVREAVEKL
ncbi:MAG: phosphoenolpyruvate--protein phosphotransferase [Zoogloea sp.]|uniref:phosphoenolpyruvate--protein phosphotransferase n=1 Tax=Zoogloea sp. TaxID=49181 RepID=UPI003F2CAA14